MRIVHKFANGVCETRATESQPAAMTVSRMRAPGPAQHAQPEQVGWTRCESFRTSMLTIERARNKPENARQLGGNPPTDAKRQGISESASHASPHARQNHAPVSSSFRDAN